MLQQLLGDRLGSHGGWRAATKHLEHRRVGSDDPVLLPSAYSNRKRRDRVTPSASTSIIVTLIVVICRLNSV